MKIFFLEREQVPLPLLVRETLFPPLHTVRGIALLSGGKKVTSSPSLFYHHSPRVSNSPVQHLKDFPICNLNVANAEMPQK